VKIIGEKKGGQNKNEKSEKQEQMEEGTNYLGQKNRKKNIREILAHLYHRISGHLDLALVGKKGAGQREHAAYYVVQNKQHVHVRSSVHDSLPNL
jgi:hypothetical protein